MEKELTQGKLKELLNYDPDTGIFTWKVRKAHRVKIGDIAGVVNKDSGYRQIRIDERLYLAHRLAWLYVHGEFPKNETDHINHKRDDNRICNLRDVTQVENFQNKTMNKANKSGFNGILWVEKDKRWCVQIGFNGRTKYLGYFKDIEDAIQCRKEANIKHGYHPNHGK